MDTTYDVIVVGAGTAGIPCAIEAAAAGRSVLLVDKAERIGGTLHVSGGHMSGAGTARQAEHGIDDSVESHYADIRRISNDTARPDITRLAVDLAAPTIDWLAEQGFDFAEDCPRIVYGHEPYGTARTYYGPDAARSILAVLAPLLEKQVAAGGITLELNSPVTRLLTRDGAVVGVQTPAGERHGSAVVIATGGFGFAPDLFRELEGAPLVTASAETSTGDGLVLAQQVGAGLAGQGTYLPTFGGLPPEDGGRVTWELRPLLVATERPPQEIYVDRSGHRWVAEDEVSIDDKERALVTIEDMTFWMVFDAAALRDSHPMVIGWEREDIDAKSGVRVGIHRADSLEDLAEAAGIDPQGLVETVERYNGHVAAGEDPDFGRLHLPAPIAEGPFYAIRNHALTLITFTGVDIDTEMRVRREDGSIIPGLYAVGEVIGAGATSGNSFCGGMLITPALAFGRHLGQRLGASADTTIDTSAQEVSA
ncbi:MAG: FAD-dependent oxidoreductase [Dermatophilaceae bacterium]